jgi:hypothetical protein
MELQEKPLAIGPVAFLLWELKEHVRLSIAYTRRLFVRFRTPHAAFIS